MDFVTMRQKIEKGAYSDLAMLKHDAELIINNAVVYNPPGTVYHIAAQKLDLIVQFYFSEQHLRYLYHTLPFTQVGFAFIVKYFIFCLILSAYILSAISLPFFPISLKFCTCHSLCCL